MRWTRVAIEAELTACRGATDGPWDVDEYGEGQPVYNRLTREQPKEGPENVR